MINKTIYYNNISVAVKITGEGTPVVFLHGYLESSEIWQPFVNRLSTYGRIILIDLPGHGKTGILGEIHTMGFMTEVVKHVLDYLAVEKCIMLGHSMGGYVTLSFVKEYPERLLAFCLFHSHPLPDTDETKKNREREIMLVQEGKKELIYNTNIPKAFATQNLNNNRSEIKFAKNIACKTPDKGIINALKGMMKRSDQRETLQNSPLPFLWILGMKDNYIDYQPVVDKVVLPPNGSLLLLEDSGHMGFLEEKEKSLGIIIDFIQMNQLR